MCLKRIRAFKNCDCQETIGIESCEEFKRTGKCRQKNKHTHTTNQLCRNGINCDTMSAYSENPPKPRQITRNRK